MRARVLAVLYVACAAATVPASLACTKEEYREKFGALPTYVLDSVPEPFLSGHNEVSASVQYVSKCPEGGSLLVKIYIAAFVLVLNYFLFLAICGRLGKVWSWIRNWRCGWHSRPQKP